MKATFKITLNKLDVNLIEKLKNIFSKDTVIESIFLSLLFVLVISWTAADTSYSQDSKTSSGETGTKEVIEESPPALEIGLTFDKKFHSFGEVTMGQKVTTTYHFKNTADRLIKITDLISSCGCTVAELTKFDYAPNEEGDIVVTLDTTLKEGLITKTITLKSDYPSQKEIHLSLAARVKMPPHPDEKSVDIIMSEKCRLCHIEAGKDLKGGYLYHKVCWQCHGDPLHKPKSINIFGKSFLKARTDAELYNAIAKGIPGTGMPRYLDKEGGRGLTEEQINSLVEFIRSNEKKGE